MQICEEVAAVIEREGHHTSAEDLRDYVMQVIDATAENISSMLQDIRALRHTEIDYINGFLRRARAHGIAVPENTRLFEMVKERRVNMSASALVCLAPVVKRLKPSPLSICWFAAVSKSPLPASPAMVTAITCSRGVKLLADAPLVEVADGEYDVIVLPGGIKGAECFAIAPCWLKPLNSSTVPGVSSRLFAPRQPPCWSRTISSRLAI